MRTFLLPAFTTLSLFSGFGSTISSLYLIGMGIGALAILVKSYRDIREGNWSVDYIAFLALFVAFFSNEWLAGAVIALMYTTGGALEAYAGHRAEESLAHLLSKIPKTALVQKEDGSIEEIPLADVPTNTTIIIRTGELVPLDGTLASDNAILTLANLTGEPLPESFSYGAFIKSGSVNAGEAFTLIVSGTLATSTYAKIITLVKDAKHNQAPFVRLVTRANIPFTLITLGISGVVYLFTGDIVRVLAVLVIATPCPLIIAAPVAFIGALSQSAKKNIIVKTPATLEILNRVTTLFFDKTGTLTLGEPTLVSITVMKEGVSTTQALSLASALEFHSIHPLARALVAETQKYHFTPSPAREVKEIVGKGITGMVDGRYLSLEHAPDKKHTGNGITLLLSEDGESIALFHFADVLKENVKEVLSGFTRAGYKIAVLTGDKAEQAQAVFAGIDITIHADCTPEEKYHIVKDARAKGAVVAMIGDGLNDAPALALADVGIVFSGTENSASIDAAHIAILGHEVTLLRNLFDLSHRSVTIARESVYVGIGLSVLGMIFASFGYIAPVEGALIQECIDATVILNALRTAFSPRS